MLRIAFSVRSCNADALGVAAEQESAGKEK
jgi:hypothetical protein